LRALTDEEIARIRNNATHYVDNIRRFRAWLHELHATTDYAEPDT
jgi:hypothetical protein